MLDSGTPFDPSRRQLLKAGASFLAGLLLAGPSVVLGDGLDAALPDPGGPAPIPPGGGTDLEGSVAGDPGATVGSVPRTTASPTRVTGPPRSLAFFNTHTNERCRVTYWRDGSFDPEALRSIDQILRDHRTDEVKEIDRNLLDLLHDLRRRLRTDAPFHVISGYRSQASNDALRSRSRGVASGSYHLQGRAIDLSVPGVRLRSLRAEALGMNRGGVGFYPRSRFVHLDVGEPRTWRG